MGNVLLFPRDTDTRREQPVAASDWVGSCVIITKRRRDRTPKVQAQGSIPNSGSAHCDRQIEEAEAALLPVISTQALR